MYQVDSRPCAACGKTFTVYSKHPNVKTCSAACSGALRRTIPDKSCEKCGKTFRPKRNSARWCSRSCAGDNAASHRLSETRGYSIWAKMIARCYRETNDNYRFYGGAGIYVCGRWRDSVQAFIDDMGQPASKLLTIDRINTLGSYTCGKCDECKAKGSPANCRWATRHEQFRNLKRNRWYTHDGKTLILKDWAKLLGIPYLLLWNNLKKGMSFETAISGRFIVSP